MIKIFNKFHDANALVFLTVH